MFPELVIPVAPVIAPAALMSRVGVLRKLVKFDPPEFVMAMASVTMVVPVAVESALSRRRRALTALSVTFAVS